MGSFELGIKIDPDFLANVKMCSQEFNDPTQVVSIKSRVFCGFSSDLLNDGIDRFIDSHTLSSDQDTLPFEKIKIQVSNPEAKPLIRLHC